MLIGGMPNKGSVNMHILPKAKYIFSLSIIDQIYGESKIYFPIKESENMQSKTNEKKGTMPIYKEKAGTVAISVFENTGKSKQGEDFVFKTINLQKSYKDKDGEWVNTNISLRVDDIAKVIMLLNKAFENCTLKEKANEE